MSRSGSGDEELERCQARVGATLRGKWHLDALLGVGGMAAVYSATHKLGKQNAIKILHPQIAVSKDLRARFEQEAHAISKLGHPGTVQVVDIDATEEGSPFMVMELLEGESLGQRAFRLGQLHPKELFGYVDALLDVLGAAHTAGIVHRDIKPDNLFVTHDGRLKVLDFGIARMKESGHGVHTRTGAMLGTTAYMAPEQIHAKPIDGRADLYAVGATMFRILAKRRIHEADSDAELLMKMGSTPAPSLRSVAPDVTPNVAQVVDCALAFNRERRYPDAATMRADVQAVLRDEAPPFATRIALLSEAPTGAGGRAPDAGAPASVSPTQPDPGSSPPVAGPSAALATAALAGEALAREDTHAPVSMRQPPSGGVYPSPRGGPPSGFVPATSSAAVTAQAPYAERTMNSAPPIAHTRQGLVRTGQATAQGGDKRTSLGVLVGVGALMILVGGLIAGAFLIWGGSSSAASKRGGNESDESDERERRYAKSAAPDDSESSAPTPTSSATDAPAPDTTGRTITKPKSTSGTTSPPRPSISAPTLPPDKPSATSATTSAPTATATATSSPNGKKPPKPPKDKDNKDKHRGGH